MGWDVFGVELNDNLISSAKKAGFEVKPDDLIKFEKSEFDLIVAFDVIEHVEQSEILDFLVTYKSLLADSGKVLLRFPNGDSPLGLQLQNGDPTHKTWIGSNKIQYFAEMCGFEVVELRGASQPIWVGSVITSLAEC